MRRAEYLQCRRGRWYVRLRVPAHLVPLVGQQHLVRALETASEAVARERRWIALSLLWEWIGAQTVSNGWQPAWATNLTVAERSPNDGGHDRTLPSLHGDADHPPKTVLKPRSASGQKDDHSTILTMMTRWLSEIEGVQTKQSVMQHVLAIREFAQSQPAHSTVDCINRRVAGEFVSSVLMQAGGSQKTVNRKISSMSSMWRWLRKRGFVDENPWDGQGTFNRTGKHVRPKRAYEAQELVKLLSADPRSVVGARYGLVLFDLIRLGLFTGCRIGELCELRVEDVLEAQKAFRIPQGKTQNARRVMPVHSAVWPVIQRRMASSSDGWILSGLTPAGPDGKRSWIVVKRYATFRQAVLGQGGGVDFHSFRRSFATYLERASTHSMAVNSSVIAELMGHVKPTLALAVYSSGLVPSQLRAAIDALDHVIEPEVIRHIGTELRGS